MTGYVRPISINPGTFKSERVVIIRTVDGDVKHLVDATSLESGLLLVEVVTWLGPVASDRYLVRFPYCCDSLTCYILAADLILPRD